MFNIFNKKKEIVLDCFTSNSLAYEFAPIDYTYNFLPEWYKKLKPSSQKIGERKVTMKHCYGFIELQKRGIILPSWANFNFKVSNDKYEYEYSHGNKPSEHPMSQHNNSFANHFHVKLVSDWLIKEKSGKKFLFTNPTWHNIQNSLKFLNGVVDYKYNNSTHVNYLLEKSQEPYFFSLKFGHPLVQIIPLDDDIKIKLKTHLVTVEEINKLNHNYNIYMGIYDAIKAEKFKKVEN